MKRHIRVISLCLLLAIVLTAFGMFSAFASGNDAPAGTDAAKLVYDMDAQKTISVSNNTYGPKVERDANGYWEMHYRGIDAGVAGTGGDYWMANAPSSMYINNKYTTETVDNGDGTTSTVKKVTTAKNTDFFIIDFDISTNSSLLDGIYFHMRFYNNTGGNAQQNYVQLNGTDLENFYLSTDGGGSCIRPVKTPGEWLNVTVVYDFSSVDEEGFAKTADWKVHVYFDGIYAGDLPGISTSSTNFYFNRISTNTTAIQNGPDASTLFANFTYKTLPRGYEGVISESGVLGYAGYTLADIPELNYCLENTPVKEDQLIATVERVGEDEPIEIYKFHELDASLKDGDVVTLARSITESLVVDSNATITFKDENGTVLTPGKYNAGDLVYIKKPVALDFTAGAVIRRTNDNSFRKTAANKHTVSFTYDLLESYAPAGVSGSARKFTYILLGDTTYTNTAKVNMYGDELDTDLNGYTLNLAHSYRFETSTDSKSSKMLLGFRNGTLNNSGTEVMMMTTGTTMIFDNLNITVTGSTPFDQRGGIVVYHDVKINSNRVLTNLKGSGLTRGGILVENTTAVVNGSNYPAIEIGNVSSSGMRQGSMHTRVRIVNSSVTTSAGHIVNLVSYANSNGTYATDSNTGLYTFTPSNANQVANDNDFKLYVIDSEISAPAYSLLSTDISDFKAAKSSSVKVDANEQFKLVSDIYISGSKVSAKNISTQSANGYSDALLYKDNYVYTTNVNLENTDLHMSSSDCSLVLRKSKLASTAVNINVGAEVSVPTSDGSKYLAIEGSAATGNYDLTYTADATWVKRSLEGAPAYSYTNKLDTHAYIFDGHEYEFIAYLGDPVNATNIPQALPAESDMLKYEWVYNIDGAWEAVPTYKGSLKASLTAGESLALTVCIPANFSNPAVYNMVYAEGYKVDVTDVMIDGVAYKAFTVPGIDPASATKDFTIRFRVADENGAEATVEREISVLDYIESALKSTTISTEDKTLVASLLNYIVKVAEYNAPGAELDPALAALVALEEYQAITLPEGVSAEAKIGVKDLGVFSAARIALDSKFAYEFMVKDGFSGEITLSYTYGGVLKTETVTVEGGDVVRVELLAYELGTPVSVTYGGITGEINVEGYMSIMPEDSMSAELTAVISAMQVYSAAAVAAR